MKTTLPKKSSNARVLALDTGSRFGYAVLGANNYVRSGSVHVKQDSGEDMGVPLREFRRELDILLDKHRPTCIAIARPFVTHNVKFLNPRTLRPIMGFSAFVDLFALDASLPLFRYDESVARRAFLGKVPRKSADIKAAVLCACRDRGWPARDDHAADALCIADFALAKLNPDTAHERDPLFTNRTRVT